MFLSLASTVAGYIILLNFILVPVHMDGRWLLWVVAHCVWLCLVKMQF